MAKKESVQLDTLIKEREFKVFFQPFLARVVFVLRSMDDDGQAERETTQATAST